LALFENSLRLILEFREKYFSSSIATERTGFLINQPLGTNMTTKKVLSQKRALPVEFTERMANLLLVCIEGLRTQIPDDERLNIELDKLGQVVNKVASNKRTDLTGEIEGYFNGRTLEKQFQETEKQATKGIALGMAFSLKDVLTDVGSYDQILDRCNKDIATANNLKDISAIKDRIAFAVKKSKSKTQVVKKDLKTSQNALFSLSKKLKQTQPKTVIDSLTKILNRSAYDLKIGQAIHDFQRTGNLVCLIECDIDQFKKFNETHGQRAGDKVLSSIASTMKNSIRASDDIFRFGGEEFVVLLYGAPAENAVKVAEKIRSEVKRDFLVFKEKELKVSISLGVAFLQEDDTETSVFERADKALHEAKRKGRDRVEVSQVVVPV
jgi:diguanylate cyclase